MYKMLYAILFLIGSFAIFVVPEDRGWIGMFSGLLAFAIIMILFKTYKTIEKYYSSPKIVKFLFFISVYIVAYPILYVINDYMHYLKQSHDSKENAHHEDKLKKAQDKQDRYNEIYNNLSDKDKTILDRISSDKTLRELFNKKDEKQ